MSHLRPRLASLLALGCLIGLPASQGQVLTVDDGQRDYGAAWIFDLAADGTIDSLSAVPVPVPVSDFDFYGSALAPLGDLNGDGTPDLAVGAPGDDRSGVERGAVWILFRDSDGSLSSRLALRPGRNLFSPPQDVRSFGSALAALGDLDADGTLELAVSAILPSPSLGSLWILSIRPDGSVARELEIGEGIGGFGGDLNADDNFGSALAALGDLDGDGVTDLAVGATGPFSVGELWILLLNADGTVKAEQEIGNGSGGFGGVLSGGDNFGWSIAALGDLDGDGVTDLAAGAPGTDDPSGQQQTGALWVLFLNPDGTVESEQNVGEGSGGFGSLLDPLDRFGESTVALGDLDGDGTTEIGVGATGDDDAGTDPGALWVLTMNADGTVQSELRLASTFTGLASGDRLGAELASLGDWDEDGRTDLAVGAIRREGAPTFPDFTSVSSALAAASSGDTVLIRGGTYGLGFGTQIVDAKSLTIQAANPLNVFLSGYLKVSTLGASQSVRLSGLILRADFGVSSFDLPTLHLESNDGRVWIDDCLVLDGLAVSSPGLRVEDSSAVILNRTQLEGNTESPADGPAGPALELSGGSAVHAYDCVFTGADGDCDEFFNGHSGGPGVLSLSTSDFLFLSGCTVRGGNDSVCDCSAGGTALQAAGPAKVLDSTLTGGQGCPVGAASTGPIEFLSGDSLSMAVNNPTRSGEPTLFTFEGPPGAAIWTYFSLIAGAQYRPALQGVDLLGATRQLDFMGRLDADGRLLVTRPLGVVAPGVGVLRLFAQSTYVLPSAPTLTHKVSTVPRTVQLGAGAMIVRLDASF